VVQRVSAGGELLDGPLDDPTALRGNLRDLRRVNRWFGGARLSCRAVESLAPARARTTILDVGTGAADIPLALLAAARRQDRSCRVTAVDSRPEVLAAATSAFPELITTPGLEVAVADGRDLPYEDRAFDIGHASLVLHHLEPCEAVDFLRELARVAAVGVVVNDLTRSRLTVAGAWLSAHLFTTNRYTRHDAPMSARRAYTGLELGALLGAAGLRPVAAFGGLAGHRLAVAAVRA
jgi:ubiquinone/menaquinone biosynthesis C-methylase UbiE